METEKDYTPAQLVNDWLPDLVEKWVEYMNYEYDVEFTEDNFDGDLDERFINRHFSDALAAFAAAQREICVVAWNEYSCDTHEGTASNAIFNAPMPKHIKRQKL